MANHRRKRNMLRTLSMPTKRQWTMIGASVALVGLLATGGLLSQNMYGTVTADDHPQATAYSATDSSAASRGNARDALSGDTSYITVKINGKSRVILGTDFTTVKSVLDAGEITLEPDDTVSPALDEKVTEKTVITIERAGAELETSEQPIAFNTVKKETSELPAGTEKVESEGEEGVMETTSLVTRSGDAVISFNVFASYVKKAPVDRVILVGTGAVSDSNVSGSSSGSGLGTTIPASEMQSWAHDYLISNGYSEADFSAAVYIINHESGWNPTATNPSSGAYGLAQALPGSKMASAGADWATNYQTQFKWFVGYCNGRYGSLQGAYNFWVANGWY